MSDDPKDGYDVGYGKPPKDHQFKKGQPSANPNGRPKKEASITKALGELLSKDLVVGSQGGSKTSMPANEVIAKKIINQAASGNVQTQKMLVRMEELRQPKKQIDAQNVLSSAYGEGLNPEQLGELTHIILSQKVATDSGLFVQNDGWLKATSIGAPIVDLCARLEAQQIGSISEYKAARDACVLAVCDALNERAIFCLGAQVQSLEKSDLE